MGFRGYFWRTYGGGVRTTSFPHGFMPTEDENLPPEKRELLVLSRYQGMKYGQIAELLDCEVGTVKVRVFRAMQALREIFFEMTGRKAS